jgi:catechol 2,3-dioxygenase-like lactoylglutathione lyase family enzyme
MDIPATLAYYTGKLGFACLGTWLDPPVYAIVARDQQVIHFRCAEPPTANPDKYADELLDAYLSVEDADALYAEYAAQGVEFARELANTPWHTRGFVVRGTAEKVSGGWPRLNSEQHLCVAHPLAFGISKGAVFDSKRRRGGRAGRGGTAEFPRVRKHVPHLRCSASCISRA